MHDSLLGTRCSASVLLVAALKEAFPACEIVHSSATRIGFFCDVILKESVGSELLSKLDEAMRNLAKLKLPVSLHEMLTKNAADMLEHYGFHLQAEAMAEWEEPTVKILQIGEMYQSLPASEISWEIPVDTGCIGAFKLLRVEEGQEIGTKWSGMHAIRIVGTVDQNPQALKKRVKILEEATKGDHRVLGEQMGLFKLGDGENPGLFWLPQGAKLLEVLLEFKEGSAPFSKYGHVRTPILQEEGDLRSSFSQNHLGILKHHLRRGGALPLRLTETGRLWLQEPPEEGWGLHSQECQSVDWATCFCSIEHLQQEVKSCLQFIDESIRMLAFESYWQLDIARTKKSGQQARQMLRTACKESGLRIDEETEASSKHPRVRVYVRDGYHTYWPMAELEIGRVIEVPDVWVCSWSLYGSLERAVAILLEQHQRCLPLWLAPEQARVVSIGTKTKRYGECVLEKLQGGGLRAAIDDSERPLAEKICAAEMEKIPYLFVVGKNEEQKKIVAVRHDGQVQSIPLDEIHLFLGGLQKEQQFPRY